MVFYHVLAQGRAESMGIATGRPILLWQVDIESIDTIFYHIGKIRSKNSVNFS